MKAKLYFLLLMVLPIFVYPQIDSPLVERDTSYGIDTSLTYYRGSAYKNLQTQYIVIPDSTFIKASKMFSSDETWISWFKKNIIPIISILVSIIVSAITIYVSIRVTKNNIDASKENLREQFANQKAVLERQLKVQLATTVDKEWIEEMRKKLGEVLDLSTKLNAGLSNRNDANSIKMYKDRLNELSYSFQVYTNSLVPSELNFFSAISHFIRLSNANNFQSEEHYDRLYSNVISTFRDMINERSK